MQALLGALVLFLLGLLGARFSFHTRGSPVGPRFLLAAGTHFLLVGVVLGSEPIMLLSPDVLRSLYPLLALSIGWIGLLFGMQLDFRILRAFPRSLTVLALLQAVIALAVFTGLALLLVEFALPVNRSVHAAVVAAAATACMSSPLGVALVSHLTGQRGRLSDLLLFVASLDGVVGVIAIQLTYAFYHPLEFGAGFYQRAGLEWTALALAVGVTFGIIFIWLVRPRPSRDELSVFLLGLALFVAGAALYLGVAALFVAITAGVLIANLSPLQPRLYALLHEWEKPVYVMLLVLLGATLQLNSWLVLPLALAYTIIRILAKAAGGWVARRVLPPAERPPAWFGLALIPQGGMPLALVMSIALSYGAISVRQPFITQLLISALVAAVVLSELVGPFLMRGVLRRHAAAGPPRPLLEGMHA